MLSVVIIGYGNVGSHVCTALQKSNKVSVKQIYSRSSIALSSEEKDIQVVHDLSQVVAADLYILAVADDAIEGVSEELAPLNKLVVHTSGSVDLTALSEKNRRGVFYPLQTFSKDRKVNFKKVPICIEAEDAEDLDLLNQVASAISKKVEVISSEEREGLHLAAVFVNNFVNHLYHIGADILDANKLSLSLLKPLIKETALKIKELTPSEAQTGPAKRNDIKTIENHLHLLKDSPYTDLYKALTEGIQKTHGKKL